MNSHLSATQLARYIDHTLLKPEAKFQDIAGAVDEATALGVYAVCVFPNMLAAAAGRSDVKLVAVCGFPSGKHTSEMKAAEAAAAVAAGASEIDMVIDLGAILDGDSRSVERDIRAVRDAVPAATLKVIIESAALADAQIELACRISKTSGADFVKTSTGFHPAGGASVGAVRLMRSVVGDELGVKASGGIRSWSQATDLISAGATRLGISASRTVLEQRTDLAVSHVPGY